MSEHGPKQPLRSDEEQHRLRFEEDSNAGKRSPEEQRRLMEEYDQARYEEAFPINEKAEKAYNEAMARRAEAEAESERNGYADIEGRILERQEDAEGKMVLVRPEANRMYAMAQRVAELRANGGEPKLIEYQENKLQELLEAYTEQAHADHDLAVRNAEINERSTVKGREIRLQEEAAAEDELKKRLEEVDFIINSTDEAWVGEHASTATAEKEPSSDTDKEKGSDLEAEEDSLLSRIEELMKEIKADPDAAEKSGAYDKAREELAKLDEALAKRRAAELKAPKDDDLTDEEKLRAPKDDDLEEGEKLRAPKDDDLTDEEKLKAPEDSDLKDDEKLRAPKDDDLAEDGEKLRAPEDDDLEEDEPVKQSLLRRAWNRIAAFGYKTGGASPAGVVRYGFERFRNSENKGKIVAFIGAAAVIGVAILGREQGWFDGHTGGSGGTNPNDFTPGEKGGHPGGTGIEETPPAPTPTGPEIPAGDSFAHPWNWMKAAMENGSIKAPAGMGPEDALHYYGEQAAAAGHKVEWYNLPNGLEAIRVDGSDDTKAVADILGQFAK